MLRGAGALLRAAHIEPSLAVTLAAGALALGAGLGARTAVVVVAVGSGQLSIGWSNDWFDRRRDLAAGRTDKPIAQGRIGARTVAAAAVVSATACVVASLALGRAAGLVHLLAVAAGWAYNLRAKRTWYSVVPWALAFGLLPAVVTLTTPVQRWPAPWLLIAGAMLGSGAHFANAIPDLDADRATAVRGLPHRFGRRGSHAATVGLVGAGFAAVVAGLGDPVLGTVIAGLGGAGLVGVAYALWSRRERLAFRLVTALLVLLAVLVVVAGSALA